jgi:GNAT superfamily N-acetyltransferase
MNSWFVKKIMNISFRKAIKDDIPTIWEILQQAIRRRREDGSIQWQDGYPNPDVVTHDIEKRSGYVLTEEDRVIAYCSIAINDEPEYLRLQGKWLTQGDFVVVHRIAVGDSDIGKGLATRFLIHAEEFAQQHSVSSVRIDTNFDNGPMLRVIQKQGFVYCGEVYFRGSPRRAYEKVLSKD